jgi:hypothetical protein
MDEQFERRKDQRETLERMLHEVEARRDKNLKEKLDSLERLIHVTFSTRTEALGVAFAKMENESDNCFVRCAKQVAEFYSLINKIKEDNIGRDIHITSLLKAVSELKQSIDELEKYHDADIEKITVSEEASCAKIKLLIDAIELQLLDISNWRKGYWMKHATSTIIYTVVVCFAIIEGTQFIWELIKGAAK